MGNCIVHESRLEWGGEDWAPAMSPPETAGNSDRLVVAGKGKNFQNSNSKAKRVSVCTEVKVKITKKQLEEMVGKMDGLTVQQVLDQLMKVSACFEAHQKMKSVNWRPNLQSIPEFKSFHSRSV